MISKKKEENKLRKREHSNNTIINIQTSKCKSEGQKDKDKQRQTETERTHQVKIGLLFVFQHFTQRVNFGLHADHDSKLRNKTTKDKEHVPVSLREAHKSDNEKTNFKHSCQSDFRHDSSEKNTDEIRKY